MSERKPGWYWVKSGRGWECARWALGEWSITESDHHYGDGDFVEFDPRIPTPDEKNQEMSDG